MGGRGGSMGGSHGMGGNKAVAPQTREQRLLAQIRGDPTALMRMSDQDALDTVRAIEKQDIAHDGTQHDIFCQRWLNATGLANETPEVLGAAAFEAARKKASAETFYHSDKPYDGQAATAVKTLKQLQNGQTAYASSGLHGSGTYLDTDAVDNVKNYAGRNGSQVKMFLNKNAKVATHTDLKQAKAQFKATHQKTYNYLISTQANRTQWGDAELQTVWLTSAGYNAYDPGRYAYKVAYSRKALTICTTIKSRRQVTGGQRNW